MEDNLPEVIEQKEIEVWAANGKPPKSFLICKNCYIKKSCPLYDLDAESCPMEELNKELDASSAEGIVEFIQSMISLQARRVTRLAQFESLEGGIIDPRVSEEIMNFMDLVNKLKNLVSDEDSLIIHVKGKSTSGVIDRLFGEGN